MDEAGLKRAGTLVVVARVLVKERGEHRMRQEITGASVYRKGDSSDRMQDGTVKGVLVRDIKLEELWPATKIDPSRLWTDQAPEWFAGGSFDFAPGNLQLIHKTRWGSTVRINLPDGKVLGGMVFRRSTPVRRAAQKQNGQRKAKIFHGFPPV